MKRIHILLEGQTEEAFAHDLLRPHFLAREVWVSYSIVATKRTKKGAKFKGGITSYQRVKNDILMLLRDTSLAAVTTMIDYYGLTNDFPGKDSVGGRAGILGAAYLETAFQNDINNRRFIPYFALHEFEALLFADPSAIASAFPGAKVEKKLLAIRNKYKSPEEINDDPKTHPSARILALLPRYRKRRHGALIARNIGLAAMRATCPHFDEWLTKLEAL